MSHRLDPLLRPGSIALIGASNNPGRIGGMPLDLLSHFGYAGQVYPINPKYEEVFGFKCYADIESLPSSPDLVVLAIAAEEVTSMLERCHAKGTRAAIVYAAGFAEAGPSGMALQKKLEQFIARTGMVVAGPNCMGFANLNLQAHTAFASVFRAVPPQTEPGRISILTQSGNVCSAVFGLVRRLGVPVSHFINTGNEAEVEFSEYLEFLAQDDQTQCVLGYAEQLRNGSRFIDAALSFAEQGKPLVIYKAGETDKGSEAVRSHTSALAGNLAIYKAAFEQLNVIQAVDFAQMADLAYLSGFRHRKGGKRIAIVTMSGALGAILADKMILAGLEVPTLSDELQEMLRSGIPDYGMVSNPIDVTGNVVNSPDFVRRIFELLGTSDELDGVIVYAPGYLLDRMADALVEVCGSTDRLFVAIDTGAAQCRSRLAAGGIPTFDDLGRAVQAIGPFFHWLDRRSKVHQWAQLRKVSPLAQANPELAKVYNEHQAKNLLAGFNVPAAVEIAAKDVNEAAAAAQRIGYPVALKILSADIAHKTEAGGVILHIANEVQLRAACEQMLTSVQKNSPRARIDGFLVQLMMSKGVAELIAGVTHDPVFGPALTVGLGGVLTELYKDVSHRLLPVDSDMAREMLHQLKAWPLMDGFRGRPKADVDAACATIASLSNASMKLGPTVEEIEINPLIVNQAGDGAFALDALVLTQKLVN